MFADVHNLNSVNMTQGSTSNAWKPKQVRMTGSWSTSLGSMVDAWPVVSIGRMNEGVKTTIVFRKEWDISMHTTLIRYIWKSPAAAGDLQHVLHCLLYTVNLEIPSLRWWAIDVKSPKHPDMMDSSLNPITHFLIDRKPKFRPNPFNLYLCMYTQ